MKYWAKFLRIIYNLIASSRLRKATTMSIETILRNSKGLLESEMIEEMRGFIRQSQADSGGFADKAGKGDIYYSLFGYFVAEALDEAGIVDSLKSFVAKTVKEKALKGVNLYCAAILYVKLFGLDKTSNALKKKVKSELLSHKHVASEYNSFMGLLALYYFEDYLGMNSLLKQYKSFEWKGNQPCTVVAATAILLDINGRSNKISQEKLMSFYRRNGGFAALKNAPESDLLSTATALYALLFTGSDLRLIKPDCLMFADSLYHEGGFRSMKPDPEIDTEYTFYGLLALGTLNS